MTPLARRRPWKLARETTTLDRLSGGRLIFGAGLGFPPTEEFEFFGEPSDERIRAARLDEGLAILDGLWSGEPFTFDGAHYRLTETTFLPRPLQKPRPPVWIAGWWPNKPPFRRAARWDGVFPELVGGATPTPSDLADILHYVGQRRENPEAPFDVALNGYTSDNRHKGSEAVMPYVEVGITWWLERTDLERNFSVVETRARIAAGPPTLS